MNIDLQIELWSRWLIQYALIGWNYVTEVWDSSCEYGIRILRSIEQAHKNEVWVFVNENELPYCVKEGPVLNTMPPTSLFYYPDTYSFTLNTRLQENRIERFDIVSAEVILGSQSIDLTSLFHEMKWKPHSTPSLYEVVQVYGLHNKLPFTHLQLESARLEVLDSDAVEHSIPLNSVIASRRFAGWT